MVTPRQLKTLTLEDLFRLAFETNDDEDVIIRTSADVTGEIRPQGLSVAGEVTVISVSTSAVKLPTTALTDRNAISIHNKSASTTLYIGFSSSVTADDTSTGGWEVPPGNYFNTDVTPDVEIWGISTAAITVKVLELA